MSATRAAAGLGFGVDIGEDRDADPGANFRQHRQPFFQPGPRNDLEEVRFALS